MTIETPSSRPLPTARGPVDMHVHLVGNGSAGTGCTLRLTGYRPLMSSLYERHVGLPAGSFKGDLDRLYARHLVRLVRRSSLAAACLFAQDGVYDAGGRPLPNRTTFTVPNDWVFRVCRADSRLLPVISIHPARRDAMDELERCLEAGAVMLKLLPNCNNVDCNDRRLAPFWKRMAEARLPFIAHVGGENTLEVVNRRFEDPRILRLPLECGVTVIAAHCAGNAKPLEPNYLGVLRRMMHDHPRLYTDNSALNSPIRSGLLGRVVEDDFLLSRMVHGSDFPVPVSATWAWLRGVMDRATARRMNAIPNLLERDVQIKRALGFPEEVLSRGWELLRLPG